MGNAWVEGPPRNRVEAEQQHAREAQQHAREAQQHAQEAQPPPENFLQHRGGEISIRTVG